MTVIDADFFLKIELAEILLWSTKQREDLSPNLTKFTEHFNKISHWYASQTILTNDLCISHGCFNFKGPGREFWSKKTCVIEKNTWKSS